jgi:hypothetical protein
VQCPIRAGGTAIVRSEAYGASLLLMAACPLFFGAVTAGDLAAQAAR